MIYKACCRRCCDDSLSGGKVASRQSSQTHMIDLSLKCQNKPVCTLWWLSWFSFEFLTQFYCLVHFGQSVLEISVAISQCFHPSVPVLADMFGDMGLKISMRYIWHLNEIILSWVFRVYFKETIIFSLLMDLGFKTKKTRILCHLFNSIEFKNADFPMSANLIAWL